MAIHAITLSWNGSKHLQKLYPTLLEAGKHVPGGLFWHIRDNGSKDDTADVVPGWKDVFYYPVDHNNDNFAKGNNYVIDKIVEDVGLDYKKDSVLFLNNDIEIKDNLSLFKMHNIINDDRVGIVGTKLLYPNSNMLQHAGVIFSQKYGNNPFHYRWKEIDDKASTANREFQAVTGACMLIKASNLKNIRFDEKLNWVFDDIDLCLTIGKKLGKKIVYCGNTRIYHYESMSLDKNPVNKMFMQSSVNYFKTKWKNGYVLDHYNYLNNNGYKLW